MAGYLNRSVDGVASVYNSVESGVINLSSSLLSTLWGATKWVVSTAVSIPKTILYKAAHALPFLGLINLATLFAPPQVRAAARTIPPLAQVLLPGFVAGFFGSQSINSTSYTKATAEAVGAAGAVAGVHYFGATVLPTVATSALTASMVTPQGFALNLAANSAVVGLGMYAPDAVNQSYNAAKNAASSAYDTLGSAASSVRTRFRANS